MPSVQKINPCLWFDMQAEEAANFYVGIFRNSKIGLISHYPEVGQDIHHMPAGTVLTVEFELDGQRFTALNGGPQFKFNEAMSLQVNCDTQDEIDNFWNKLSEGGDERAKQCGWLKDKYGVSWQIVPSFISQLFTGTDKGRIERAMTAMLKMKKLDILALQRAAAG